MEGGHGLRKPQQGFTNNLQAYLRPNNLGVRSTMDLHSDSGLSKTKNNFCGVFEALSRDNQWGTTTFTLIMLSYTAKIEKWKL